MNDQGFREEMLGRIREALQVPAPHGHGSLDQDGDRTERARIQEWLPAVGKTYKEQHALFLHQCAILKTELHDCASPQAAAEIIQTLSAEGNWKRVASHEGELIGSVVSLLPGTLERVPIQSGYDPSQMEQCDAGITEGESLIAQTGSVCVTSRSSGGRALSVLPPHHIVVARQSQLVPDLTTAYRQIAQRYAGKHPSFISFISGPSRTGDIERILVLGAHGPKRLTILLLPNVQT